MPFLGSQTLPVSSFQGSEVAGTPSVSPGQVPHPPGSLQGCRSQASTPATLISAPFIPQIPTLPGFLGTVLASEVIPAELLTASLLSSVVAPLNEELCGHLAVPHVHCLSTFPGCAGHQHQTRLAAGVWAVDTVRTTAVKRGGAQGRRACGQDRRWPGMALTPHSRACLPTAQLRDPLTTLAYEPAPHPAPRSSRCRVTPSPPPPSLWL